MRLHCDGCVILHMLLSVSNMKLALLHSRLSGYLAACLRVFKSRAGAELLIYCWPNQPDAPFDTSLFADLGEIHNRRDHTDAKIEAAVRAYQPDAILTSGWADKGYVNICRSMRKQGVPVIAGCDTQWTGSLRQHIASWIAPWHIRHAIDILWVTGERQATLGRALGFGGERLWDGYYACDWERFARRGQRSEVGGQRSEVGGQRSEVGGQRSEVGGQRSEVGGQRSEGGGQRSEVGGQRSEGGGQRSEGGEAASAESSFNIQHSTFNIATTPHFLFVGRYVPEKGLDTLAEAYRLYSDQVEQPWGLRCAGAGPMREALVAAGAEDLGFVQPQDLPALMHSASAFVLPSRFEPWGVVAHEAAASGLPLILSDACGAAVHLLRNHFNGHLIPTGNARALAEAMVRMTQMPIARREAFGEASFQLSKQYTPERWAETLVAGLGGRRSEVGGRRLGVGNLKSDEDKFSEGS